MLKQHRHFRKTRKLRSEDQLQLLEDVITGSVQINFEISKKYPTSDHIHQLIADLNATIQNFDSQSYKAREILIEVQLAVILSLILGVSPIQFLPWSYKDWDHIEQIKYLNKEIFIVSNNSYATGLVSKLKAIRNFENRVPDWLLFQNLNLESFMSSLNILFIFNGNEVTVSLDKIYTMFGRFMYLNNGKISSVREFLKEYYGSDSHIELLVELRLVDTIHYNTMMRN